MANIILVLGGVRSGKSLFAEDLVLKSSKKPVYIATSEIFDAKMQERVEAHRLRRQNQWIEIEAPISILEAIENHDSKDKIILVECLSLWLSNLIHYQQNIKQVQSNLLARLANMKADIVFVSSEVGQGIMPENALARQFCDEIGQLNQYIAAIATHVYFIAAGLPLVLKG